MTGLLVVTGLIYATSIVAKPAIDERGTKSHHCAFGSKHPCLLSGFKLQHHTWNLVHVHGCEMPLAPLISHL
jgi:hypothetical protein